MQDYSANSIKNTFSVAGGTSSLADSLTRRGKAIESADAVFCDSGSDAYPSGLEPENARGSPYISPVSSSSNPTEIEVLPSSDLSTKEKSSLTLETRHREETDTPKHETVQNNGVDFPSQPFKTKVTASGLVLIAPSSLFALVEFWSNVVDRVITPGMVRDALQKRRSPSYRFTTKTRLSLPDGPWINAIARPQFRQPAQAAHLSR